MPVSIFTDYTILPILKTFTVYTKTLYSIFSYSFTFILHYFSDNPLSEQYLQCALIFCLLCLLFFSVIILYLFQLFKTKSYNHAITISVLSILIYFLIWCISIFLRLNNLSTLCKYDGNGVQYRATDR